MFVFLSKLLAPLIYPLGLASAAWLVAAVLAWRQRPQLALRCLLAGIAIVLLFSNGFVAEGLQGSLENDYPPQPVEDYPRVDAIVVLGGATSPPLPPRLSVEVEDAFDRLLEGVRLLRAGKADHLILTGGTIGFLTGSDIPEARRLADLALECGVAPEQLILETRSRNTYENALYTAEILEVRGWRRILLVTSARHMPRAVAVFAHQGVDVVPAPTDFQVVDKPLTPMRFLPDASALRLSTGAIKEYVGGVVYGLRGYL